MAERTTDPASQRRDRQQWSGVRPGSFLFWMPVVLFGTGIFALYIADSSSVFEHAYLNTAINGIAFVGVSLIAAILSGQGFTRNGSVTLLLLGAGLVAFGVATLAGAALIALGDINAGVTTHNSLSAMAGLIHLIGATLIWRAVPVDRRRLPVLAGTYLTAIVVASIIVSLAQAGSLPVFITAEGPSSTRTVVLLTAIFAYLMSSVAFSIRAITKRAEFLHWYSMGLALIGIGLAAVMLGPVGSPIGWVGRAAQIFGQGFVLNCLLVALRSSDEEHPGDAIAQSFRTVEVELLRTRRRYQLLIDAVSDGVLLHESHSRNKMTIVEVNATLLDMLGYTEVQLRRLDLNNLVAAHEQRFPDLEAMRRGSRLLFNTRLRRQDGTELPVEVHSRLIDDNEHQVVLSAIRDISERVALEAQRETERARLRQVIDETPIGMALVEHNGEVTMMNRMMSVLWGRELANAKGVEEWPMYHALLHGTDRPMTVQDWPAGKVLSGSPFAEMVVDLPHPSGAVVSARMTARPIGTSSNGLDKVLVIAEDVTEDLERERLARALDSIRTLVTSTFDADRIQHQLTFMGVEALRADGALLLKRVAKEYRLVDGFGELRGVARGRMEFDEDGPIAVAVRERGAVVCPGATCPSTSLPDSIVSLGMHAAVAVPLLAQGHVVALCLFTWCRESEVRQPQLEFANRLVGISALALDNSESYQRERTISDTLQQAILAEPEQVPGLDVASIYRPASNEANVGGDFYDLFRLSDQRVMVLVGDVSGKGLAAARLTSLLRDGARAYSLIDDDPGRVTERLNWLVYKSTPPDAFATVFLGVLDLATGFLRYTNAGHTATIVACAGEPVGLLPPDNPVCGAFPGIRFTTHELRLRPHDLMVLYTDGVTEARKGEKFLGDDRFAQVVESMRDLPVSDLPEELLATVSTFSDGQLRDDVVILALALSPAHENAPSKSSAEAPKGRS